MGANQKVGRRRSPWAWAALILALVALLVHSPAAEAAGPARPSQDPFYTYAGTEPLGDILPGTVLDHRTVRLSFGPGNSTPIDAEQLLYRTTGQRGEPTVTVTTVLLPPTAAVVPTMVEYLSSTTVSVRCAIRVTRSPAVTRAIPPSSNKHRKRHCSSAGTSRTGTS